MASRFPKPADFKPEATFPAGHLLAGKPRCQAWNRNRGQQCSKLPMDGSRVCRNHGGASLRGAASPRYKGKGYSKYLPEGLARQNQAWLKDPNRLALEYEMALSRSLISEDLQQIKNKTSPAWEEAADLFRKSRIALTAGKTAEANTLLGQLGRVLTSGQEHAQVLDRIMERLEGVRKLVDTQRQIQVDTGEYMQRGQVIMLLTEIVTTLRDQVAHLPGGQKVLTVVGERVRKLLGVGPGWLGSRR